MLDIEGTVVAVEKIHERRTTGLKGDAEKGESNPSVKGFDESNRKCL